MVAFLRSWLWLASSLLLSCLAQQGLSVIVFRDSEPPQAAPKRLMVRGSQNHNESYYSGLDPQRRDSFYWSGNNDGHETMANFTVDTAEDKTSIVSMEKFRKMLKSVHCTNSSLTMGFKDHASFAYVRRKWQWVNDVDNRTFIMVAGTGDCAWNTYRVPFNVSQIVFDDRSNAARLHGTPTEWKKAVRNYELTVGYVPGTRSASASRKRDIDKELTVDFNHPLPMSSMKFDTPVEDLEITYSCEECGTEGSFEFGFHIKTEMGIPKEASFSLAPNDVAAKFIPTLGLSGNYTDQFEKAISLGSIPIAGISIPGGVLDVGPQIDFDLEYTLGPVSGSTSVSTGVTMSLSNSAELEIVLTSPDISASGWTPAIKTEDLKIEAKIEAGMELALSAGLQLTAEALGQGFEAGVDIKPYYGATLSVSQTSEGGACEDDSEEHSMGVMVQPSAGVSLNAEIAKADDSADPLAEITIASLTMDMESACYGFGPTATGSSSGGASATPSSSKVSSSSSVTPTSSPSRSPSSTAYPSTSTPYTTITTSSTSSSFATPSSSSVHLHGRSHRRHGWH